MSNCKQPDKTTNIERPYSVPLAEKTHEWMLAQRELVPEGSATAEALDYSLKRWVALTRYLEDGAVPIDNTRSRT